MSLKDKVAIITGAGRGLGRSMSVGFAEQGATVVLAARTIEQLEETAKMVSEAGGKPFIIPTNVAEEDQVASMVDQTLREFGRLDVMVNNAGITAQEPVIDMPFKRWKLLLSVNLDAMFLCSKLVLPQMVKQKSGVIINVSSILAHEIRMSVAYGVTKIGTERFTQGLAREMRREEGIAVTCVRPYFVKTEVVMGYMEGKDTSAFEDPIIWQKYPAILADADPGEITGKIWDKAALEEKFGKIA